MSLGFSVYFGLDNTMEENIALLNKAKSLGFSRVFTSLHIPEANYSLLKQQIKEFFKLAKSYNMDIISDISPNTFKFLEIKNMDLKAISDIGVKTIRIDFGYTVEEISRFSKNPYGIKIQLNASTVTEEFFYQLDKFNPDYNNIDALHNFYPRIGTGISEECLVSKNKLLKERNIKCGAFVQSNNRKRSPLKDGLPTLEDHRGLDVRESTNHLFALGVDSVFIGDSFPSIDELRDMNQLKSDVIEIDINLKVKNEITDMIFKEVFTARIDEARDVIRAAESRNILKGYSIDPINTVEKKYGDVTLDNINYGRYMGELQVLKINQNSDNRTNVVASVLSNRLYLLKYINGGRKFYFRVID